MCCCCFKRHGWTFTAFLTSIVIALLVFGAILGVFIYFGGPLPTEKFDRGTQAIFYSNILTAFVLSIAIVVVQKEWKSVATFVIVLIFILGITASSFYVCYVFNGAEPTEEEIAAYVQEYAKDKDHKGKAPPILDYIQRLIPCCGGEGFEDYIQAWPTVEGETFTVPDSCCTSFQKNPRYQKKGCGKNLDYVAFNNSMWFHERLKSYLPEALKNATHLHQLKKMLLEDFTNELTRNMKEVIEEILENDKLPQFDKSSHEFQPLDIEDRNADAGEDELPIYILRATTAFIKECEKDLKRQGIDPHRNPREQLKEVVKKKMNAELDKMRNVKIWEVLPINVFGCGTLLALAKDVKMLLPVYRDAYVKSFVAIFVFTVIQAVLNCLCLILYNFSYWSLVHTPKQAEAYALPYASSRATTDSATKTTAQVPPDRESVAIRTSLMTQGQREPQSQSVAQRPGTKSPNLFAANDFTTPRTPLNKSRAQLQ